MDIQILAATLATLAAIFAGLNGGAFNADEIQENPIPETNTESNSLIPKIPLLNRLTKKPKPENPIKAQIKLPKNSKIPFKNAEITLNQNTLNTSKTKISSQTQIKLQNTTGKITIKNQTRLKADTQQINTNKVTIKQKTKINTQLNQNIEIKNTDRIELKYSNTSISPAKNSEFGINTEKKDLNINSFKGNMNIDIKKRTITLNGKVDKLAAGKYTLNH